MSFLLKSIPWHLCPGLPASCLLTGCSQQWHWRSWGEVGLFLPSSLAALAPARLPVFPSSELSRLHYSICLSYESSAWKCLSVAAGLWVPPWPLLASVTLPTSLESLNALSGEFSARHCFLLPSRGLSPLCLGTSLDQNSAVYSPFSVLQLK